MKFLPELLHPVIEGIECAFERFPNLRDTDAQLAFSGGKDSIALAYALAAMGRPVRLRAVDMGYSDNWRHRIRALADVLALPIDIVEVASLISDDELDESVRKDLALRRAFLDSLEAGALMATPCTNCYNCKILSLVHADVGPGATILFAHHATDVLASFLKSVLMFHDRWAHGNTVFDRARFRSFGRDVAADLRTTESRYMGLFERYLEEGAAQTSEPPLEHRELHGRAYTISRPLFFVEERTTAALVASMELRAESSGCGHSAAASTRTPREIVHHELLPFVEETTDGRANLRRLFNLVVESVRVDGTVEVDVRTSRHLILGIEYKGGPNQLADRL